MELVRAKNELVKPVAKSTTKRKHSSCTIDFEIPKCDCSSVEQNLQFK